MQPESPDLGRAIAVIGMAGRFPKARDLAELWRNLEAGVEAVTPLSEEELLAAGVPREVFADPAYVRMASRLDGVEEFDAGFFGYTPREAEILDPQQRLFLEHAWQALEDAGYAPGRYEGLIGIYAGVAWNTYLLSNLVSHRELFDGGGGFQIFIGNDKDFMPTRASYKLNLKGPSLIVQTSCSTSLVAVHLACLSLLNFECDIALVGGATVRVPQDAGYLYQDGGLGSPDGHCRSFDERAAGTIFGSGVGVVALKRLSEALADGDAIRAVILGSAINNDGSLKVSYTAPSVEGQAEVVASAQAVAGVDPESVSYVETHGTGTALGDPIEVAALAKVFAEGSARRGWCGLGSIKSNLGHLDAAAGIAGFLKTVLALQNRRLPPSLHYERPNPKIDFESSPFYVVGAARDWPAADGPRRAGVSSFGVGGTNAHVILEEAPEMQEATPAPSRPVQLLLLSARTPAALERATAALGERLATPDAPALADAAYTLQVGRTVFEHRRALVAADAGDAARALLAGDPERLLTELDAPEPGDRPVAFLFPGQGAQHPGMAAGLYRTEESFRTEVDRCCRILEPLLGLDLRRLMFPPAGEEDAAAGNLERTEHAQPALFTVEYALARLWMAWGIEPRALLGHSIGEYVAACLAGVFSLEDALRLVAARGRLMQSLPPGAMAAVPLPAEEVRELLPAGLSLAAVNEPERCVVSGDFAAVAALEGRLAERGIEARRLHTSHAFHSAMMEPILEPFRAELRKVRLHPPAIPYLSNLTGTWATEREATDPEAWVRHLRQPVLFAPGLATLVADASPILLEVGPGRTLTTLARRQAGGRPALASLPHPQEARTEGADLAALLTALGRLWMAGREIDWARFYAVESRRRVPLPTYPFERQRYWIAAATFPGSGAAPAAGLARQADPADWFYLPAWRRTLPAAPPESWSAARRTWWLLDDGTSLGAGLAARLRAAGQEVAVHPYGAPLPEGLEGGGPDVIVHLWTLGASPSLERGYATLLHLAHRLAAGPAVRLEIVGQGLLAVTGDEPVAPETAALLGAARVLPQELPQVSCRVFDVSLPAAGSAAEAALLDRLVAELASGRSGEREIALRGPGGTERWVEAFEPVRLEAIPDGPPLPEGAAVLIAGRLEGAGLALARSLARERRARLALLVPPGSAVPSAELESLGAEVMVLESAAPALADAAAEARLGEAVVEVRRRFGSLQGVVVTSWVEEGRLFRPLGDTGPEDTRLGFAQAAVARTLDRVLTGAGERPAVCLLLATVASALGGLGYATLASAGRWLAAFARESRRGGDGLPWTCVDLDAWQAGGGEETQVTRVSATLARLALSDAEGTAAVWRAAAAPGLDRVVVSTADLAARLAAGLRRSGAAAPEGVGEAAGEARPAARHARPKLPTPYTPPATDLEAAIARIWGAALGFEEIGVHDNFFELGGDSFAAVQAISRLRAELGRDVAVAKLYQGLTVRSLAALLEEDEGEAAGRRSAQLEERREAMDRRQQFLERRRARKRGAGEPVETADEDDD
jgi:acyl transferase domain-containing protein